MVRIELSEEDVLKLGFEEAYKCFLIEKEGIIKSAPAELRKEIETKYTEIRFGFNINFDIHDYFNQHYYHKPKSGSIRIGESVCHRKEFYTELEERESVMKQFLISLINNDMDVIA